MKYFNTIIKQFLKLRKNFKLAKYNKKNNIEIGLEIFLTLRLPQAAD